MEKQTENGLIKVNNVIFTKIILLALSKVKGRCQLSNPKAKILGGIDKKLSHNEIIQNISLEVDNINNKISLTLYVITEFGYSIKDCTSKMIDSIEKDFKTMFPHMSASISLKVVGVRSKKIVTRDIEIIRKYEVK